MNINNNRGLSRFAVLIVIVNVCILAALAMPQYLTAVTKTRVTAAISSAPMPVKKHSFRRSITRFFHTSASTAR
jgi:Tfp pilus assembly protein PilE